VLTTVSTKQSSSSKADDNTAKVSTNPHEEPDSPTTNKDDDDTGGGCDTNCVVAIVGTLFVVLGFSLCGGAWCRHKKIGPFKNVCNYPATPHLPTTLENGENVSLIDLQNNQNSDAKTEKNPDPGRESSNTHQ
jgi:hypothetical protein